MDFRSNAQLETYIASVLNKVIHGEVRDAIVTEWRRIQQENVYDAYHPMLYNRRHSKDGGLKDPDSFQVIDQFGASKLTQYVLANISLGNNKGQFANQDRTGKLINDFIEGMDGFAGNPDEGMPARPYTEETVAYLNNNKSILINAFIRGFKKHGIDITAH